MKVRAKFTVSKSAVYGSAGGGVSMCYRNNTPTTAPAREITLTAEYDKSNPEDVSFAEATPNGTITFYLNNPDLKDEFQPGQQYYVEFTRKDS